MLTTPPPSLSISSQPQPQQRFGVTDIDIETRAALLEDHPKGEIEGALVRHFLPLTVGVRFDSSLRRATQIADAICSLRKSMRFQREFANLAAPRELLTLLQGWVKANQEFLRQYQSFREEFSRPQTIGEVLDSLLDLQRRSRSRSPSFPSLQELQPRIVETLIAGEVAQTGIEYERPRLIYASSWNRVGDVGLVSRLCLLRSNPSVRSAPSFRPDLHARYADARSGGQGWPAFGPPLQRREASLTAASTTA